MTREERIQAICARCEFFEHCGYIDRNMRDDCLDIDDMLEGYDAAIEDVIAWLKENADEYILDANARVRRDSIVGVKCWDDLKEYLYREKGMTQIATTIEQSKKLLAAGLSPDSADMLWLRETEDSVPGGYRLLVRHEHHTKKHLDNLGAEYHHAWSLSRLIDIHGNFQIGVIEHSWEIIESLVQSICFLISYGDIDEKYLVNDKPQSSH